MEWRDEEDEDDLVFQQTCQVSISLSHESEPASVIMCYSRAKDHFLLAFKLQNFYWSFDKFLYSTGPIYGKELNIFCLKSKT